ncbi:MAG: ABC transporter ATP-binding protein [Verrucomicrobiae bacterium]|nr:ABC transporter ATP-binding protein [Verrucomicrobiae bacterium]
MTVKDITFRHSSGQPDVLRGVSFEALPGRIHAILGPNGSGKTTLFKCLTGLWRPQRGEVFYNGQNLLAFSGPARARLIAVVPQEHEPPFPYSVEDMVLMGRAAHVDAFAVPSRRDYETAEETMRVLGIDHLRDKAYTRISGGERQLALVARALAQQTPILLLDEPTSHLDFRHQLQVLKKVRWIAREKNLTVLMTLHDPNLALLFADQVVALNEGGIQAHGPADEVITEAMLARVYGVEVTVLDNNGIKVVSPRVEK